MSRRRAALTALLAAPLLVAGATGGLPAAQAVTGSPPVTVADTATTYPGNVVLFDPLANDSDPDGEQLEVCRVGSEDYRRVSLFADEFEYNVFADEKAKPGTYTFTYYACDFSYLSAGTVSLTVETPPDVRMTAIKGRPGYVRLTNPADFVVRVYYGSFREDRPDGAVRVRAGASKVLRVERERIDYIVYDRKEELYVRTGRLDGIRLPGGTRAPVAGVPAPRWGVTR